MDFDPDHQAQRVGDDVALAALDLLAGIIPTNPAAFGGLHALAIDDTGSRAGFPAFHVSGVHHQMMIEAGQQTTVAPVIEIALHRRDRREVSGQHPPLAAGRCYIQDRVRYRTQAGGARPPRQPRLRQERLDQALFPVCQIACIAAMPPLIITPSGLGPSHLDLRSSSQTNRIITY